MGERLPAGIDPGHQAETILELDRVLELVAAGAETRAGREALRALRPASAERPEKLTGELTEELARVGAWMELVAELGPVPLGGVEDLRPFLEEIRPEESWLPPRELLIVAATLRAFARVGEYRRRALEEAPEKFAPVAGMVTEIEDFGPLVDLFESCISDEEELRDDASLELREIRRQIVATRSQIAARLQEILHDPELEPLVQDKLVTIRNQRYVLPLKNNFRQAIPGIIHDHSRTRQTCFVEPLESVALNNRLALLLEEERQEEINILKLLAARLREQSPAVNRSLEAVLQLDLLQAKARFGLAQRATIPELAADWRERGFALRAARHPLLVASLPAAAVVPIDIEFPPGRIGLVISGANTGGKTVSLKTTGLLCLMARCGLPLPVAADSRVPLFARVFAAIGDEQNLAASLSTFSGHLLAVRTILKEADANSLVLLDELGVGTDPREGAALARAVLVEFKQRQTLFLVTTHYNDVKAWAYEEEGVSSVAVAFDPENFRPLYHLQYGVPGLSNALKIAEKLGFPAAIVERARGLLGEAENRTVTLAARLEKRLARIDEHEKELFHLKQQVRIEAERARRLSAELQAEKEKISAAARQEVAGLVRRARERFRARLAELEAARREFQTAREELLAAGTKAAAGAPEVRVGRLRGLFNQARAEVEELLPEAAPQEEKVEFTRIAAGDRVVVAGRREPVPVVEVDSGRRRLTVLLEGNLRVTLGPEKVVRHLPDGPGGKPESEPSRVRISTLAGPDERAGAGALGASGVVPVLNLVGKRVEEAADLLVPFLDQALLTGSRQVEIIHGHGTGRLRRGLHEFLRTQPQVSAFYHPDPAAGGAAITIVELLSDREG